MALKIRKALIIYCSPAGSTEHVARVIKRKIETLKTPVTMVDVGRERDLPFIINQLPDARDNLCLYVGSPVYASHAVPPVMEFLSLLPAAASGYSVPFVTWGGVSSGIALSAMAKALEAKGHTVLGAAKVLAKHALMWTSEAPLGEKHPDAHDDRLVEALVEKVHAKLEAGTPVGLPLSVLNYQPANLRAGMEKMNLEAAREKLPCIKVNEGRCNRCGLCLEQCPVEAISLSPYPRFSLSCICCFNCVRLCPEGAITADLSTVFDRLRDRSRECNERPSTEIFV